MRLNSCINLKFRKNRIILAFVHFHVRTLVPVRWKSNRGLKPQFREILNVCVHSEQRYP